MSGIPAFDFYSALSGIGDTIASNRKDAARKAALEAASANGVSYGDAMRGLIRAGDLQGAQMFANLQTHKDSLDAAARSDARQAARDAIADKHWAASFDLQKRAADRADQDSFAIKEITMPDGSTQLMRIKTTGGPEGLISTGAPTNTAPANPFATGNFKNADQAKAAGFTDRMLQSEGILTGIDGQPGVIDQGASIAQSGLSKLPFGVGNFAISEPRQKYEQAKRDLINAQLRRESGAVISPSEFENADRQYFPVPGDTPDVIKQKNANRRAAIEAMGREGGGGYRPQFVFNSRGGLMRLPKLGEVQDGHAYKGGDPADPASWIEVKR
jgi:hypothetical protein